MRLHAPRPGTLIHAMWHEKCFARYVLCGFYMRHAIHGVVLIIVVGATVPARADAADAESSQTSPSPTTNMRPNSERRSSDGVPQWSFEYIPLLAFNLSV